MKLNSKLKKIHFWEIISIVLLVLLIFSYTSFDFNAKSKEEIGQDVVDFINAEIFQGQAEGVLISVEEEYGLYSIKMEVEGQELNPYVTKDGKLLFPQGVDTGELSMPVTGGGTVVNACEHINKVDKPQMEMFVMSFCPYGQQAQSLVIPVADFFGDWIDIEPRYVVYPESYYPGREDQFCEGGVCAMHGLGELHENMRQACVWKYDKNEYWTYVECIIDNCDSTDVDECWEQCTEDLNTNQIENCWRDEGVKLMERSTDAMEKYGVSGSEAFILNEERLQMSSYRWDSNKLRELICCGFEDVPDICDKEIVGVVATAGGAGSC